MQVVNAAAAKAVRTTGSAVRIHSRAFLISLPPVGNIANEALPMPMLNHVAEQVGADPASFELYARREETRMNHVARLLSYLEMRSPTGEDRRAALLAAIETASTTDKGALIANAIIVTYRERRVLLPVAIMIERMGLAARAIARRRAEAALISDLDPDKLETLDCQRRSKNRPGGGVKVGHGGARMRPPGGRSPSGGLMRARRFFERDFSRPFGLGFERDGSFRRSSRGC